MNLFERLVSDWTYVTGFLRIIAGTKGITAESEDGIIMGVRHRQLPMEAVQFHPESLLSLGDQLAKSWFRIWCACMAAPASGPSVRCLSPTRCCRACRPSGSLDC